MSDAVDKVEEKSGAFSDVGLDFGGDDENERTEIGEETEYNISSIPNDFNIATLCNLIDKGSIYIPLYQRPFVWDKARASRFIESLILGLPVPQMFLYQIKGKGDRFWVIDGQQRLLSIYYFSKGRFPRRERTVEISYEMKRNYDTYFSQDALIDDELFSDFKLSLKTPEGGQRHWHGSSYEGVSERLEMRTIRTIVIQQYQPDNYNAAFEIFDRLNTGSVTLSRQQMRRCIYDSYFIRKLDEVNINQLWRAIVGVTPAANQRDVEVILRVFAMLKEHKNYTPPMFRFLNKFCANMLDTKARNEDIEFLFDLFNAFLYACEGSDGIFLRNKRFRVVLFESVFVASMRDCYEQKRMPRGSLDIPGIENLRKNKKFEEASQHGSAQAENVRTRLRLAQELIKPL